MVSLIIIGLLTLLLIASGYVIFNLLKKVELFEDFISGIEFKISNVISEMEEIDASGAFESEDEVGAVFKQLKDTVDTLKQTYDG